MKQISTLDINKYLEESPDLQEVLTIFRETMESYKEAMKAMGQKTPAQIFTGNTSTVQLQQTSLSTANFEFKTV